jgi:DNA-directed RNA polymerase specialized sigma24 family protein
MEAVVHEAPSLGTRAAAKGSVSGTSLVIVGGALALAGILDQTDPPLMKRAQRYEREALEELFDRSVGRIYALCFALSGRADDAERLVGVTLQRALDGLPTFNGDPRAFDGWVLRLAATTAGRQAQDGSTEASFEAEEIRRGYARLPGHDQEVVALRLLAGMETDRVAQATRRSPVDVRNALADALRLLGGHSPRSNGGNLQAFDQAVERVMGGGEPEEESAKLLVPVDATELLRTVSEVSRLKREPLGPHATARLRTVFVADAAERRAVWVQRHQKAPMVPGIVVRRGPSRLSTGAVLVLIALIAVGVGGTIAIFSMFSGPDSPAYPLKRFAETALLAANRDPVNRADFELKMSSTRSREAEDMAVAGRGDLAVTAVRDHFDDLRAAGADLLRSPRHDQKWLDQRNRFGELASQSTQQIEADLTATHQREQSDEVKALTTQFQADRKQLDQQLGQAAPPATPSPSPS